MMLIAKFLHFTMRERHTLGQNYHGPLTYGILDQAHSRMSGQNKTLKESLHIILMTIVFFEINQLHSLEYRQMITKEKPKL